MADVSREEQIRMMEVAIEEVISSDSLLRATALMEASKIADEMRGRLERVRSSALQDREVMITEARWQVERWVDGTLKKLAHSRYQSAMESRGKKYHNLKYFLERGVYHRWNLIEEKKFNLGDRVSHPDYGDTKIRSITPLAHLVLEDENGVVKTAAGNPSICEKI